MIQSESDRYALSFTSGALLSKEAAILAPIYIELKDWDKVRDLSVSQNLLQARTYRTGVRATRETIKRLSALSGRELKFLDDITASERGHLMWAAACRRYDLIGDFAEEVLRERFLTLARSVTYSDYDSFFRAKSMWHDELGTVADSTYKKLRGVLFRMMAEASLIDSDGVVEPTLLSARVLEFLSVRRPSDIRFFPIREY